MTRSWYKRFGYGFIYGSTLIELTYKEAWVWSCLLDLASSSPVDGIVLKREGEGYTLQGLSYEIKTPVAIIKSAIDKLVLPSGKDGEPKIVMLDNNIIKINKWSLYQSEYERLKKYRQSNKKGTENDTENAQNKYPIDIDIEVDIEKEKEILKEKGFKQPVNNLNDKPISKGKQKYNYFKGMELERKHNKVKDELKAERELLLKAKDCYEISYTNNNFACSGSDKPMCNICLSNQAIFKADLDKQNNIPETYAQCENYIKLNCYYKDQGIKHYDFCMKCASDNLWGEQKNHWGNNIIRVKG